MIWKILIGISLLLSSWATWASYENTKTIKKQQETINNAISLIGQLVNKLQNK